MIVLTLGNQRVSCASVMNDKSSLTDRKNKFAIISSAKSYSLTAKSPSANLIATALERTGVSNRCALRAHSS